MNQVERAPHPLLRLLPIVGLAAVVAGLMLDVGRNIPSQANNAPEESCAGEVSPDVVLSREQLAAFLTISERDAKVRVQDLLQAPFCHLSPIEVRAGVPAERAVYPLAFDPETWLVVLYEGDEYAGYQFRFAQ